VRVETQKKMLAILAACLMAHEATARPREAIAEPVAAKPGTEAAKVPS